MGSILTTPSRRGYSKTRSGNRMKISEKNTWKREVDYGIQQARAGVAEANEGSRQAQEAINIISSPPEQGVFGRVSKRIPRTPLGGREEPTHMREERQRMKGGPPQVRPSEQAGKGKRPLVFVGDKQWNEYLNFNKRKRYDD